MSQLASTFADAVVLITGRASFNKFFHDGQTYDLTSAKIKLFNLKNMFAFLGLTVYEFKNWDFSSVKYSIIIATDAA